MAVTIERIRRAGRTKDADRQWLRRVRVFFDRLGSQLGYKTKEDWYNVSSKDIYNNGGKGLIGNHILMLQNVYPEHRWELERFKWKPKKLHKNHRTEVEGALSIKS